MLERLNHYREMLNCLPLPALLTDESKILLQNTEAETVSAVVLSLLEEGLPQPPAVAVSGKWTFQIRPLDGYRLVLAEQADRSTADAAAVSAMRIPLSEAFSAADSLMPAVEELEDPALRMQAAKLNRGLYQLYRSISNYDLLLSDRTPRLSRVELNGLLSRMEQAIPQPCTNSGVTLHTEIPERPVSIQCDPQLLETAVLNLLSNAFRFADPESKVILSLEKKGCRAVLTIRNSGIPADLNGIYGEKENALRRTAGVGLELVRSIASQIGGTFLLHTREHETIATLAFPICCIGFGELRCSVIPYDHVGGFNRVLLGLSDVLPLDAFLPEAME